MGIRELEIRLSKYLNSIDIYTLTEEKLKEINESAWEILFQEERKGNIPKDKYHVEIVFDEVLHQVRLSIRDREHMPITKEQFEYIMDNGEADLSDVGCPALAGLNIIAKYLPDKGITGVGYSLIYSVSVDEIVEAGITKHDAEQLRKLNWMIDGFNLACFV